MKKVTKSSVNYRRGTTTKRCGTCAMFHARTNSCDLVAGVITSPSLCDKWIKKEAKK